MEWIARQVRPVSRTVQSLIRVHIAHAVINLVNVCRDVSVGECVDPIADRLTVA
jgi:hypothetical protein